MKNKSSAVAFALIALTAASAACSGEEPTPFDAPPPNPDEPVVCDPGFFEVGGQQLELRPLRGQRLCRHR